MEPERMPDPIFDRAFVEGAQLLNAGPSVSTMTVECPTISR
jgi:hypothetical protein